MAFSTHEVKKAITRLTSDPKDLVINALKRHALKKPVLAG